MFLKGMKFNAWLPSKQDLNSGTVVFLVAIPLCIGIAVASGAPMISGLIAGMVGGIVVSCISGTETTVSGPAAGLVVVVSAALAQIGSFSEFLVAVVLAGAFQLGFSFLRLGWLSSVVPFSVVRGMIAGIGTTLILKQIPHALGQDLDYEGDLEFFHKSLLENTFTDIFTAAQSITPGALTISVLSIFTWMLLGKIRIGIPRPLVIVFLGVGLNQVFWNIQGLQSLGLATEHLLNIPLSSEWHFPEWSAIVRPIVWTSALLISAVASLESLLTLEAADQLDPANRLSNGNQELRAQGIGNIVSGFLGGLPIAAVVLRSAANIYSGAYSWRSSFLHGVFLLIATFTLARFFQMIPLASISVILMMIAVDLIQRSPPRRSIFFRKDQFLPYLITAGAILFSNLLVGILLGTMVGLYFMLKTNQHAAMTFVNQDRHYLLRFNRDILFIHTADLKDVLVQVPDNSIFTIDATKALVVDQDVRDVIAIFSKNCSNRNIQLRTKSL